jgi:hypothetical protein
MTAITDFLFPSPARRSPRAILGWWERRRLHYNAIVGATGVTSLTVAAMLSRFPPHPHPLPLFQVIPPIIVIGVLANVFYFLGPVAETAIEKFSRGTVLPTGPMMYRMGLTFSMGLAALPMLFTSADWVFRVVRTIFGF